MTISVANFSHGSTAQAWQLTAANAITRLPDVPFPGSDLTATLPPQSITLFVVPGSGRLSAPTNLRITR